ncbi:MAG: hypothetical protein ACQEUZ_07410 [Pseudomonadota bacterium]
MSKHRSRAPRRPSPAALRRAAAAQAPLAGRRPEPPETEDEKQTEPEAETHDNRDC